MIWKKIGNKVCIDSPYVRVEQKVMQREVGGESHEYFHFGFSDFCNVVPITAAGEVVLVRQFRMGIEALTLEVPGGVVDAQDGEPRDTALRELSEETGFGLSPGGQVVPLGWSFPNPAIQDNRCHFFAAGPVELVGEIHNDETESTEVVLVTGSQLEALLQRGEITHALALNAFMFLTRRVGGGSLKRAIEGIARGTP